MEEHKAILSSGRWGIGRPCSFWGIIREAVKPVVDLWVREDTMVDDGEEEIEESRARSFILRIIQHSRFCGPRLAGMAHPKPSILWLNAGYGVVK